MCVSGRLFAVVIFAFLLYNSSSLERTFLAPTSSFQPPTCQGISPNLELGFSTEVGKETSAFNSNLSCSSRFRPTPPSVCVDNTGWTCPCGQQNGPNRNWCSGCGSHYSTVKWYPSVKTRTRSASKKRRERKRMSKAQGPVEEPNPLQPFGAGEAQGTVAPWVASTPTRSVAALMPQTTSAPSAAAEPPSGAEEQRQSPAVKEQILSLKQMLEQKGVNDEDILSKLAALEKLQETPEVPQTLSHRTINQLQKAEKVYESTLKQIQELDKQLSRYRRAFTRSPILGLSMWIWPDWRTPRKRPRKVGSTRQVGSSRALQPKFRR